MTTTLHARGLVELSTDAISSPPQDALCASWAPDRKMFRGTDYIPDVSRQEQLDKKLKQLAEQYAHLFVA